MSSNRDDQKKDPLKQGDPKRPHATLDLKAVEVKASDQKAASATTSSAASAARWERAARAPRRAQGTTAGRGGSRDRVFACSALGV